MRNEYGVHMMFMATIFNSSDDIQLVYVLIPISVAYEDSLEYKKTCMNCTDTIQHYIFLNVHNCSFIHFIFVPGSTYMIIKLYYIVYVTQDE